MFGFHTCVRKSQTSIIKEGENYPLVIDTHSTHRLGARGKCDISPSVSLGVHINNLRIKPEAVTTNKRRSPVERGNTPMISP